MITIHSHAVGRLARLAGLKEDLYETFGKVSLPVLAKTKLPSLKNNPYWLASHQDVPNTKTSQERKTFTLKSMGFEAATGYAYNPYARSFTYTKPQPVHVLEIRPLTLQERWKPVGKNAVTGLFTGTAAIAAAATVGSLGYMMPEIVHNLGTLGGAVDSWLMMIGAGGGLLSARKSFIDLTGAFRGASVSKVGIALSLEDDLNLPYANFPALLNTAQILAY